MRSFVAQVLRFGAVGGIGFVIDVGIFNLLRTTLLSPEHLHEGPVWAKVISTCVAIIVNWLGNRYWTFRAEVRRRPAREAVEFAVVSLVGLGIGLGCLWVSHYLLGFTSLLADNIASNIVGLGLGTLFRFALYRYWVFNPRRIERLATGGKLADLPVDAPSAIVTARAEDAAATTATAKAADSAALGSTEAPV